MVKSCPSPFKAKRHVISYQKLALTKAKERLRIIFICNNCNFYHLESNPFWILGSGNALNEIFWFRDYI